MTTGFWFWSKLAKSSELAPQASSRPVRHIQAQSVPRWINISRSNPAAVEETFETVVGLEVHAQLNTQSKMFCRCHTDYSGADPNTHVCPVCLGMPGVLPVINAKAVEQTIMTGLALNCEIPGRAKFDRKNYPYPDLMKGYQISEFDQPLCINGWVDVD